MFKVPLRTLSAFNPDQSLEFEGEFSTLHCTEVDISSCPSGLSINENVLGWHYAEQARWKATWNS